MESKVSDARENGIPETINNETKTRAPELSLTFWFMMVAILIGGFSASLGFQSGCTDVTSSSTAVLKDQSFQEKNARRLLKDGTLLGAHRFSGSKANEIEMPQFLLKILNEFTNDGDYRGVISDQLVDFGAFPLDIIGGTNRLLSVYRNIRNIAFRISDTRQQHAKNKSVSSILVNCHYDSVIDSPGASDDFVSCAVMLEVIRAMFATKPRLLHDIIFLFNGAEENLLQASHAFVTQHHWMKDVKMFVNLDSAGSGGRQLVFQAGPGQPWIIQHYAEVASQPYASVVGQDVFEAGVIPSDTDFRIFRDFGRIPGIDIAYIQNGYVYHTMFDTEERIPPACIQNSGTNLLNFVIKLANSPYVENPELYTGGEFIYFDFLGLFVVHYPLTISYIVNIAVCLFVILKFFRLVYNDFQLAKCQLFALLNHLLFIVLMLCLAAFQAFVMHCFDHKMSWYSMRFNIIGVYLLPLVWLFFLYHSAVRNFKLFWPTDEIAELCHFEAAKLIISLLTFTLTIIGVRSSYLFMLWIVIPISIDYLFEKIFNGFIERLLSIDMLYLFKLSLMYGLPCLYTFYMIGLLFEVFIPIMGRSATKLIPDLFIAVLVVICSFLIAIVFASKVYITKSSSLKSLRFLLFHSTISYLLVVNFTRFGFPFSGNIESPRTQRVIVIHVNRVFRNTASLPESYDSGLWILPFDHTSIFHLSQHIGELEVHKPIGCFDEPYCGLPYLYPLANFFKSSYYLPRQAHTLSPQLQLQIIEKIGLNETAYNLTFSVHGPSHTHVYFMVHENISFYGLSLYEGLPVPISVKFGDPSYKHYFIYNAYGIEPKSPLIFWAVFNTIDASLTHDKRVIKMALNGHYTDGPYYRTSALLDLVSRLPVWSVPMVWSTSYERWAISLHDGAKYLE